MILFTKKKKKKKKIRNILITNIYQILVFVKTVQIN